MAKNLEKEYEALYNEYRSLVVFVASLYLKSSSNIDDVVQEVFLDLFKNISKVRNYKAYLTTAAKNTAIRIDKQNNESILVSSMDDFSVEHIKENETLSIAIDELNYILSVQEINIVLAHLYGGYTFPEIANKHNLNKKTVQTIYYRALKKCQKEGFLK